MNFVFVPHGFWAGHFFGGYPHQLTGVQCNGVTLPHIRSCDWLSQISWPVPALEENYRGLP